MGFHIILLQKEGGIRHKYVDSLEEMADISGINKNTIVYQGERDWVPAVVGDSELYKLFAEDWYRAGIKAQKVFQQQAKEKGFMLESINQDKNSFKAYADIADMPIKRGDFIVRNAGGVEVDVKCRSFRRINNERYFDFAEADLNKHWNMSQHTQCPVIIAVYQRNGDGVRENRLFMFEVKELRDKIQEVERQHREDVGFCYRIPLSKTYPGFDLLEKHNNQAKRNGTP